METLRQQILPFGETVSTCSQAVSPCQPFSLAGKRKGTEDDRYLWPEMLRVIRTVRPRWVVGENVFGIVNWSEGMVFDKVCSDLEAAGYEVQPYIIPACGVGAPHRRDRCWFVAHTRSDGGSEETEQQFGAHTQNHEQSEPLLGNGASAHCTDAGIETMREGQDGVHAAGTASDADRNRCRIGALQPEPVSGSCGSTYDCNGGSNGYVADTEGGRLSIAGATWRRRSGFKNGRIIPNWDDFPTQSPVRGRNDGLSGGLDGITIPKWRIQSIKAYGNAIVPQVALQIFETINEIDRTLRPWGE